MDRCRRLRTQARSAAGDGMRRKSQMAPSDTAGRRRTARRSFTPPNHIETIIFFVETRNDAALSPQGSQAICVKPVRFLGHLGGYCDLYVPARKEGKGRPLISRTDCRIFEPVGGAAVMPRILIVHWQRAARDAARSAPIYTVEDDR